MEATCVPYENAELAAQLDEAVANIHGEIPVNRRMKSLRT